MMAKQNKTSKIKRNNKIKTNKLKRGGSTSGLLRTTAKSVKPTSYSLSSGDKPSSVVSKNSIKEANENVQRQNISPGEQNAESNATKSENNKPKNTQNSDPTNFKMTLPPNHSWGKTLGFGLGVGIITGSVILATSH